MNNKGLTNLSVVNIPSIIGSMHLVAGQAVGLWKSGSGDTPPTVGQLKLHLTAQRQIQEIKLCTQI